MEKKKVKNISYQTEEQQEIIKFMILVVVISLVVAGIYILTRVYVTKDFNKKEETKETEVTPGTINYDVTIVGELLDRPYDEYYALAFDSSSHVAAKYQVLYSMYASKDDKKAAKLYLLDLSNALNKPYVADKESNPKAQKIEELKFGEITLVKIKKGKIVSYIEDYDAIAKELKINDQNK